MTTSLKKLNVDDEDCFITKVADGTTNAVCYIQISDIAKGLLSSLEVV